MIPFQCNLNHQIQSNSQFNWIQWAFVEWNVSTGIESFSGQGDFCWVYLEENNERKWFELKSESICIDDHRPSTIVDDDEDNDRECDCKYPWLTKPQTKQFEGIGLP